jgi:signal peptidase I
VSGAARSIRRVIGAIVLVAAAAIVGGLASGLVVSVVTDGASMLPSHRAGDFVVVARTGGYEVGQVVAYRDDSSGKIVLHRIVGGDATAFDMRGDNNTSIDPTHPAAEDLLGREVLHVPRVGVAFRTPAGIGLVLGVLVLVGGALVSGRRRSAPSATTPSEAGSAAPTAAHIGRPGRPGGRRSIVVRVALVVLDLAVVGGVAATFVIRPHTVEPTPAPTHTGSLSYATSVPVDEVYPTGEVDTGDPVFLQLVDRLDIVFRYRTEAPAGTTASARVRAELTDGSGWSRTFDVAALTPVLGDSLELTGSLDLAGMRSLVERVTAATGMPAGPLGIVVIADVDVDVDGHLSSFRTELPLQLNQLVLRTSADVELVDADGDGIDEVSRTAPVDATAEPAEPYQTGGVPALARKTLFALLILMVAVTAVGWPQVPAPNLRAESGVDSERAIGDGGERTESDAPAPVSSSDGPPVRASTVAVTRLVLPSDHVLVEVADEDALHRLAIANGVPVFESDDGAATVITGLAVHRWRSPAATPTLELPAVGRRLFTGIGRDTSSGPIGGEKLDAVVRYLADPVVNHRAATTATSAARPPMSTEPPPERPMTVLRRALPDDGSSGRA